MSEKNLNDLKKQISLLEEENSELKDRLAKSEQIHKSVCEEFEILKKNEEFLKQYAEYSPIGFGLFDTTGKLLQANTIFGEIWAININDVKKCRFNIFNNAKVKYSNFEKDIKTVLKGHPVVLQEHELKIKPKTKPIWLHTRIYPLKNKLDEVEKIVVLHIDISDFKTTNDALRSSRKRYRTLFDQAGDAIFIINPDGSYRDVNDEAIKLFGYTKDEFLSKKNLKLVAPEYHNDTIVKEKSLFKGITLHPYEKVYINKSGKRIPVEINVSLVKNDKGKPLYLQSIVRDISKRVKSEKQLRAQYKISRAAISVKNIDELYKAIHEALSEVIDTTNFFIALYDKNTDLISFPYFIDEKDSPPENLTLSEHPTGTAKIIKTRKANFNREIDYIQQVEAGEILRYGAPAKVWMGVPLMVKEEIIGAMVVQHYQDPNMYTPDDIPLLEVAADSVALAIYRKKADEALEESRNLYNSIVESMSEGLFVMDTSFKIQYWNKAMERIAQTSREEILNSDKKPWEMFPHLLENGVEKVMKRAMKGKLIVCESVPYTLPNGKTGITNETYIPLKSSSGKIKSVLAVVRDITEKIKISEEKDRLQDQLYQAQKMESIGRLAGGIAHDFNNILTGIIGYAELLKMKFQEPDTLENQAAKVILNGSERAAKLTQQLLGFARGGKYNPISLNINRLIQDTIIVSEKILDKKIKIILDLSSVVRPVEVDENQMSQVINNIIFNARDAMPKGGELTITTSNVSANSTEIKEFSELPKSNYIKISFADTGIGINEDDLEKIFDPFFTKKGKDKGTGLGLAMVYGIIKNHNGVISVESEPDIETTFTIYLPATGKKEAVEEEFTYHTRKASGILIVDDEPAIRNFTSKMLEQMDYVTFTAEDGIAGLEVYKANMDSIDLVLLDIVMPRMAGHEAYFELLKIDPDVKVLLMSGYSKDKRAKEILKAGAAGFIQKPFKLNTLTNMIAKALSS